MLVDLFVLADGIYEVVSVVAFEVLKTPVSFS